VHARLLIVKHKSTYIGLAIDRNYRLVRNTPPLSSPEDTLTLLGESRSAELCTLKSLNTSTRRYVDIILLAYRGKYNHSPSVVSYLSQFPSFSAKTKLLYILLLLIPKGFVATYSSLAKILSTHPRAVGALLARNPYPLIIPCHRVVRNDGSLGGYLSSQKYLHLKKKILTEEGVEIICNKVSSEKILTLNALLKLREKAARFLETSSCK